MERTVLDWLLEETSPEVRLRTLKEYEKLTEDDERVTNCKNELLQSKVYERAIKKLKKDKPWDKFKDRNDLILNDIFIIVSELDQIS